MRRLIPSPAFVVALLALVLATTGVSYAAASIDHSAHQANPATSALKCPSGTKIVFGLCMKPAAAGPVSFQSARTTCNNQHGRLPSLGELDFIAGLAGITWANGQSQQYEFTSTNSYDDDQPVARDQPGNIFTDARAQTFWYHCLTIPLQN
jgi:hypothetical protein